MATRASEQKAASTDEWQYGQAASGRAEIDLDDDHDDYLRMAYPFLYFDERGAYGQLTGSTYQRCIECEREMVTGMVLDGGFVHEPDCPEGSQ